jgi:hypothetical protein
VEHEPCVRGLAVEASLVGTSLSCDEFMSLGAAEASSSEASQGALARRGLQENTKTVVQRRR